jgi:hypothetical protein
VIGSGSSAIQVVPGIQKAVKHIDHYVRGKTWIATPFAANKVKEHGADFDNCKCSYAYLFHWSYRSNFSDSFTKEEIRSFKDSAEVYKKFRKGR